MPGTEIARTVHGGTIEIVKPNGNLTTFQPSNFKEAVEFATYVCDSDLIPKAYRKKPANVVVAMMHGMEVGLPWMQALSAISVINGQASMWGDALLGIVMAHPDYVKHEEYFEGEGDKRKAVLIIERRGHKPHKTEFSVADAKRADLWDTREKVQRKNYETGLMYECRNDSPWYCYPDRMLQMRARGFGLRDKFADALKGIKPREEVIDYKNLDGPIIEGVPVTVIPPTAGVVHAETVQQQDTMPQRQAETVTDGPIGKEKANEFYAAWKKSGWKTADVKSYILNTLKLDITSSEFIPLSRFADAMKWANSEPPK